MHLWTAVHTQWRGAGMGVIGLDYQEVRRWADHLEIDLSPCMWSKIKTLEQWELKEMAKQRENTKNATPTFHGMRDSRYGEPW